MKESVSPVLADWTGHSMSRGCSNFSQGTVEYERSLKHRCKFCQDESMCVGKVKVRECFHQKGRNVNWGMRDDSCIGDPSSSPIMVHRDKWLHTLSAKYTPLSASCSYPMLLESREQAVERGRWEPLATFQDWLGCDICSYTSHFGFFVASTAGKQLLMPTPSAITNMQG